MLRRLDPILAVALILALLFSLYGIRWGRVECWNRDQVALRGLSGLRPWNYFKPPFHTYLNHSLVLRPIARGEHLAKWLSGHEVNSNEAKLLGSRLLVVALFLGTIWLAYLISLRAYGQFAARVIALLFATSAGFIEYDHFLSCDSPLLFWMMLTLFFAQRITVRPEISNYLLVGFLTGICTATKYSGLAVGIVIVTAHFLSRNEKSFKALLLSRRLAYGLLMVPVGFIAGNPYAILDWRKFSADFVYYCYVTPHYEGQMSGHAYVEISAADFRNHWAARSAVGRDRSHDVGLASNQAAGFSKSGGNLFYPRRQCLSSLLRQDWGVSTHADALRFARRASLNFNDGPALAKD